MTHADRFFEDYIPGDVHDCGSVAVTEGEIIEFARRYDPQPMHIDREAAARGRFGGLVASGWHTAALAMRLYVDHYLSMVSSLASPGVDEVRWPNPLRPGDVVRVRATVLEATPSTKRSDRGVVRARIEAENQRGERVLSVIALSIIGRRPPSV
jgi:acyl dehydratase